MIPPAHGEVDVRPAAAADAYVVGCVWREGWHEVHAGRVPMALEQARLSRPFEDLAVDHLEAISVAEVGGEVAGFVSVHESEVQHLYVDRRFRGTTVAASLLAHAERQVAGSHSSAWLAVVAPNERARRFYERHGWTDTGPYDQQVDTPDGTVSVPVHRYVKDV